MSKPNQGPSFSLCIDHWCWTFTSHSRGVHMATPSFEMEHIIASEQWSCKCWWWKEAGMAKNEWLPTHTATTNRLVTSPSWLSMNSMFFENNWCRCFPWTVASDQSVPEGLWWWTFHRRVTCQIPEGLQPDWVTKNMWWTAFSAPEIGGVSRKS